MAQASKPRTRQQQEQPRSAAQEPSLRPSPANQNDAATAALIARLHQRPSPLPIIFAVITAVLWTGLSALIFLPSLAKLTDYTAPPALQQLAMALATWLLPVMIMFAVAIMIWRARHMRQVSEALIHAALRLGQARPEARQTQELGEEVKHEIDQVLARIEHSLSQVRDLHLEVRQELAGVERTFGDSEDRIHALLSGLQSQRQTLSEIGQALHAETLPLLERLEEGAARLERTGSEAAGRLLEVDERVRATAANITTALQDAAERAATTMHDLQKETDRLEHIATTLQSGKEEIATLFGDQAQTLEAALSALQEQRELLQTQVEELQARLIAALESARATLQESGIETTETLQQVAREVSTGLNETTHNATASLQQAASSLLDKLDEATNASTELLGRTTTEATTALQKVSGELTDNIREAAEATRAVLEDSGAAIGAQLAGLTKDLDTRLATIGERLHESLQASTSAMQERLEAGATAFFARIDEVSGHFTQTLAAAVQELEQRSEATAGTLAGRLDEMAAGLEEHLQQAGAQVLQRMEQTQASFSTSLQDTAQRLADLLHKRVAELHEATEASATQIEELSAHFTQTMQAAVQKLAQSGESVHARLAETVDATTASLDQTGETVLARMREMTSSLEENLLSVSGSFLHNVAQARNELEDYLRTATGELAENMEKATQEVFTHARETGEQLHHQLAESSARLISQMSGSAADVSARLEETLKTLANHIGHTREELETRLEETGNALQTRVQTTLEHAARTLREATGDLQQALEQGARSFDQHLEGSATAFFARIDDVTGRMSATLNAAVGQLESAAQRTSGDLARRLQAIIADLDARLGEAGGQALTRIEQTGASFTTSLTEFTAHISDMFELGSQRLQSSGEQTTAELKQLTARWQDLGEALHETAVQAGSELETAVQTALENLTGTHKALAERLQHATRTVSGEIAGAEERLTSHLKEAAEAVVGELSGTRDTLLRHLAETSETVISELAGTGHRVSERMGEAATELSATIRSSGGNVITTMKALHTDMQQRLEAANTLLTEVSAQVGEHLDSTGQRFVQTLDTAASHVLDGLNEAADTFDKRLSATVADITAHYDQRALEVTRHLQTAGKVLAEQTERASSSFGETVARFHAEMEQHNQALVEHVEALAGTVRQKLEGTSAQITGRFEHTATALAERLTKAGDTVSTATTAFDARIAEVLKARENMFAHIVAEIETRLHKTDELIHAYLGNIDHSLEETSARAAGIASELERHARAAEETLTRGLAEIERTAEGRIAHLAEAIREQHERLSAAIRQMLENTSGDFATTAELLRKVAQQVVQEVEQVRAELKQAMLDLPQQARANTEQMHRMVSDQIAALNALADMVRRQAVSMEVSGPGIRYKSARPPLGKSEGAASFAPQTFGARENASRSDLNAEADTPLPLAHAVHGAGQGRQHDDLTRRIDELVDAVNIASRELLLAIEGAAPEEVEERWRQGDMAAYTHHLAMRMSDRLQRVVQSDYERSAPIHDAVNAYIARFEELLQLVSEAPHGDDLVQSCLESDSGRLYLLLARAIGRMSD